MIYLGYARVSTEQQHLDLQLAALSPLCGDKIWQEKKSAMGQARSELVAVVAEAKRLSDAGEEVVICCYSLSRLGRRLVETVSLLDQLRAHGIGFRSLTESIDTSTPMGRALLSIIVVLAQAEVETLSERTRAGLAARKALGVKLGPKTKDFSESVERAKRMMSAGTSLRSAAKQVGMSQASLSRRLNAASRAVDKGLQRFFKRRGGPFYLPGVSSLDDTPVVTISNF